MSLHLFQQCQRTTTDNQTGQPATPKPKSLVSQLSVRLSAPATTKAAAVNGHIWRGSGTVNGFFRFCDNGRNFSVFRWTYGLDVPCGRGRAANPWASAVVWRNGIGGAFLPPTDWRTIVLPGSGQPYTACCMTAPALSVAMSAPDGRRFLSEAIESVLGQTFGDFEFPVLDDGLPTVPATSSRTMRPWIRGSDSSFTRVEGSLRA